MDRTAVLRKIFWRLDTRWHLRHRPSPHELSVRDTVKALQALLLAQQGAMLTRTLSQVFARPVRLQELVRMDIILYQEGVDQRVWRAQATLTDGDTRPVGMITARAPAESSALTRRDFDNLRLLHTRQARYCARPYDCGSMPVAGGVAAYTVEWLEAYTELVFEISHEGGVFLANAPAAHRLFSPQASRRIWRRIVEILWWYTGLRKVNIQAGDFVARVGDNGDIDLKLTTARELVSHPEPVEQIDAILRSVITASGYLGNGRQPFDRHMPEAVFLHRMQAVLQRRFGDQASRLARRQWVWFQQGALAQQEDWLKQDCILATYERLRTDAGAPLAWEETCRHWTAYAEAVQAGRYPPSWWFPAAEIPALLDRLAPQARGSDMSTSCK